MNHPPATAQQSGPAGAVAATPAVLQARGLALAIDGRCLWRDLDLALEPGARLGISGRSGTGKSLLLRTLAGLDPLQHGRLTLCGRPAADWSMPEYRARVAYLPQRPALREGSVETALRAPFRFRVRRGTPFPADRAEVLLALLGRDTRFLHQRTEHLSGGEAQIACLLRTLLVEPRILLLDEPTAALDAATATAIERLVAHWLTERPGRACVWTSHDHAQLARTTDDLCILDATA